MKFYCKLVLFGLSLIFLSNCGKSEVECLKIESELSMYFVAAFETVQKAAENSFYRTDNFARDIDSYLDKLSSLEKELCSSSDRKKVVGEQIECLKGIKIALITNNEMLIRRYTIRLSQMFL